MLRCLFIVLPLAACGPDYQAQIAANNAKIAELNAKRRAPIEQNLAEFRADPAGCSSPHLEKAQAYAITDEQISAEIDASLENMIEVGSSVLDVADTARELGCLDVANALYEHVIRTYVGSGYAALRQRAEIGLRRM